MSLRVLGHKRWENSNGPVYVHLAKQQHLVCEQNWNVPIQASLGGVISTEPRRTGKGIGFPPVHGRVEEGSSSAVLVPNWLGPHQPQVPDQQLRSHILLAGAWPGQERLHPSLHTEVPSGTANQAFSDTSCYSGITAFLCACLCHSLNLCLLHSSWNELKWLSGCFLLP